jgi:hypothetical protein
MPLRSYLFAIAIFANEVKGKSALVLSRDLGTSYKTCFVLAHKLREAMAEEMKGRIVGGEGKSVEVDGGYFGGYVKPANRKEDQGPPLRVQSERQAQGGCDCSRAWRQFGPGSVQCGECGFVHPLARRQGHSCSR